MPEEEYYVERDEMWSEIHRLYTLYPYGEVEVSPEIALMFDAICKNLKKSPNFSGYTYDLESDALELILRKFKGRKFKRWQQKTVKIELNKPHPKTKKMVYFAPVYGRRGKKLEEPIEHLLPDPDGNTLETHEMHYIVVRNPELDANYDAIIDDLGWEVIDSLPEKEEGDDQIVPIMRPSNFFGYVTTIAYRSFQSTIVKESRYRKSLDDYKDLVFDQFESRHSEMRHKPDEIEEEFYNEDNE
jgi:hypothetical protein